jgi:hypothetical protein
MWLHANQIRRHLAGWAVCQCPYHWPDGLRKVIEQTVAAFKPDHMGIIQFDIEKHKLRNFLKDVLWQQPQVQAWNVPKSCSGWRRLFRKPPPFVSVSATGGPPPFYDFIDIDALAQNVARSIIDEWVKDGGPKPRITVTPVDEAYVKARYPSANVPPSPDLEAARKLTH